MYSLFCFISIVMKKRNCLFLVLLIAATACTKLNKGAGKNAGGDTTVTPGTPSAFVKGADVSWITEIEAGGIKFYNANGVAADVMQLMKDAGINAIRLRAWVNPAGGWNNQADVLNKAIRANNAGMQVMIDFHYSDSWADPGKQTKPAAWASQNITALQNSVRDFTVGMLRALKAIHVIPKWVQVGNETNDGMLWPEGRASANMGNFAALVNAGYNAVKAVDTSIKVIVHLSNGYDNSLFRWMFDGLKSNNAQWDIIGVSLYASAANRQTLNTQCLANMNDMVSRYNKPVMICETGMSWTDSTACNAFLSDIITKTKSVTKSMGLGVWYWKPEAYNNWQGYTLGAFNNAGRPTIALKAFN